MQLEHDFTYVRTDDGQHLLSRKCSTCGLEQQANQDTFPQPDVECNG